MPARHAPTAPPRVVYVPSARSPDELEARIAAACAYSLGPEVAILARPYGMEAGPALVSLRRGRWHTRDVGARLWVAGRADLAVACGADGLHLPSRGMRVDDARAVAAGLAVSAACHDPAEITARAGADVALVSPVYDVPGKGPALGLAGAADLARHAPMPVILLGGVTEERLPALASTGCHGIAVMRAVEDAPSPAHAICTFLAAWSRHLAPFRG